MAFINGKEVLFSPIIGNAGSDGDTAEFNIAYGDTEPTDTSKLWIKTSEPEAARVVSKVEGGIAELEAGIGTLPATIYGIAAAAVGTKVYLFGGNKDNTSAGFLKTIYVFDTESNAITTLSATLPTAAGQIAAVAVGTKIYLFGGVNSSTSSSGYLTKIYVFDTESNTITTLSAALPAKASDIAAAAVGTKIYLFGGVYWSSGRVYRNTIYVFNTESNTITTLSVTLPTSASDIAAAAVGTKIYLFGGQSGNSSYLNTIYVFDTESNTITTLSATLPAAIYGIAAAAVGIKVYLFGGRSSNTKKTIYVFDAESNTITTLSVTLPTSATDIAAAAVGTKIYLFGGFSSALLDTINVFVVAFPLAVNNILIEASTTQNIFNLLPTVELGVNAVYLGNADGVAETAAAALYVDGAWTEI